MTSQDRIEKLERELHEQRQELTELLAAVAGRVAPGAMAGQALKLAQENAVPLARQAGSTLRRHPLAAGLVGAGLAWILLGRHEAEPVPAEPEADVTEDGWAEQIDTLRRAASEALRALEAQAASGVTAAHELADARADMMGAFAQDLRARFADGLEGLGEDTRANVIAAREATYAARLKAQEAAVQAGTDAKKFAQDHPLVTVALGLAVGAAIGAAAQHHRSRI
ncbi:hypothetical protein LZA78_14750 [Sinirhodobacter sp. WL0062]|uniref:DUF3618 domain-containing protein n=1 Tax=Rhodobacter flavimaris TaxID=2907145 RepID=A0ABS8YY80_9RHOB|nr:hypothetical protein [Sinirhodobacter sp. WL0062]MCE5974746.1 hypothetical protein [Sinirhodobacter sp. WL0062]